jgi:hypothetical protein
MQRQSCCDLTVQLSDRCCRRPVDCCRLFDCSFRAINETVLLNALPTYLLTEWSGACGGFGVVWCGVQERLLASVVPQHLVAGNESKLDSLCRRLPLAAVGGASRASSSRPQSHDCVRFVQFFVVVTVRKSETPGQPVERCVTVRWRRWTGGR